SFVRAAGRSGRAGWTWRRGRRAPRVRAAMTGGRSSRLARMQDLGERTSYLAVKRGVPVFASDGERLGRGVRVLREAKADMFDGIVFDTTAGPGGHKFVDAPEVGEIYERGVILKLDAAEAARLPKPTANQSGRLRRRLSGL